MEKEIINKVKVDIINRCYSPDNFVGVGSYEHIESVDKHDVELANYYEGTIEDSIFTLQCKKNI